MKFTNKSLGSFSSTSTGSAVLCKLSRTIITVQIFRFMLLVILRLNNIFLMKFHSDRKLCQFCVSNTVLFSGAWVLMDSIVLTCHGFVCIHSGKSEKYICTIFENRKVLFERQLFFLSIFIHYQVWLFRESFLKLILQLKSRCNISMSDFFMDRLHYHLELRTLWIWIICAFIITWMAWFLHEQIPCASLK